jgi:hypothetical protein
MAELTFYLSAVDENAVARWLFNRGAVLIPDLRYADACYEECRDYERFLDYRVRTRSFYVTHANFTVLPLKLVQNEAGLAKWHFIMPRHGGPAIDLLLAGELTDGDMRYIRSGSLGYYRSYYTVGGIEETAPKALMAFYRDIVTHLKQEHSIIKTKQRLYLVGQDARERLRHGARLVGLEHLSFTDLESLQIPC